MAKIKVRITGKVQGVFFRHSAREQAEALKINGWIKNQPDGSVLSEASGPRESLLSFIAWCKQGPPRANVEDVNVEWLEDKETTNKSDSISASRSLCFEIIG